MMIPLTCYGLEGSAKMKSHEKFMNNISTPGCPHGLSSSSANFCSRSDFNFGRYLTSDSFEHRAMQPTAKSGTSHDKSRQKVNKIGLDAQKSKQNYQIKANNINIVKSKENEADS